MSDFVDPFVTVPPVDFYGNVYTGQYQPMQPAANYGSPYIRQIKELQSGGAGQSFHVNNTQGLWLGSDDFASAPFSVTMAGALTSVSTAVGNTSDRVETVNGAILFYKGNNLVGIAGIIPAGL